jgi:hypothetical protein
MLSEVIVEPLPVTRLPLQKKMPVVFPELGPYNYEMKGLKLWA